MRTYRWGRSRHARRSLIVIATLFAVAALGALDTSGLLCASVAIDASAAGTDTVAHETGEHVAVTTPRSTLHRASTAQTQHRDETEQPSDSRPIAGAARRVNPPDPGVADPPRRGPPTA